MPVSRLTRAYPRARATPSRWSRTALATPRPRATGQGVHRLHLTVRRVELLDRTHPEQLAGRRVPGADERDRGLPQPGRRQRVDVLGWALVVGEPEVRVQQVGDVRCQRVVDGDQQLHGGVSSNPLRGAYSRGAARWRAAPCEGTPHDRTHAQGTRRRTRRRRVGDSRGQRSGRPGTGNLRVDRPVGRVQRGGADRSAGPGPEGPPAGDGGSEHGCGVDPLTRCPSAPPDHDSRSAHVAGAVRYRSRRRKRAPPERRRRAGSPSRSTASAAATARSPTSTLRFEPPDQGLCAGAGFVLEPVNSAYRIYKTNGTSIRGPFNVNDLFDEGAKEFTSDPRCWYDPTAHAWFATILFLNTRSPRAASTSRSTRLATRPGCGTSTRSTRRSTAATASRTCRAAPASATSRASGIDQTNLYVTTDEFSINGPQFHGGQIYAIDKADLVSGAATAHFVRFGNLHLGGAPRRRAATRPVDRHAARRSTSSASSTRTATATPGSASGR